MAAPKTAQRTGSEKEEKEEKAEDTSAAEATDAKAKEADAKAQKEAEKEAEKQRKAQEKKEAEDKARQAKIDAGDLIVTDAHEFESNSKETKVGNQVQQIIENYRESDKPLVFADVCGDVGAKYPEDILPAFLALEHVGLVRRFDARKTGDETQRRRSSAYLWIGDK